MTEALQQAIISLHEELGLPQDQEGNSLFVEGNELRFQELRPNNKAAMFGVIGHIGDIADKSKQSQVTVLNRCLTLHGARFAKLATPEVLTVEDDELLLCRTFDADRVGNADFLNAAESMLNELEYWKNWLDAA